MQLGQTKQVIKTVVNNNNTVHSHGAYIARNDAIKVYSYNGCPNINKRNIQRMQNAGYEFQHVVIKEHR